MAESQQKWFIEPLKHNIIAFKYDLKAKLKQCYNILCIVRRKKKNNYQHYINITYRYNLREETSHKEYVI